MAQLALFRVPRCEPLRRDRRPCCFECGVDTLKIDEWYMVRDEVWGAAVRWNADARRFECAAPWSSRGAMFDFLCIGCLEARLGRPLVASDFTDVPVNTGPTRSRRLKARREAE